MEEPTNEEYYSSEDENASGKASWIWNKGLGFGKKILFTSFVISSAPLALPPLVIFSAIGLMVWIPSGVFLASYACSETLMSKLLPIIPQEEEGIMELREDEMEDQRGLKRNIKLYEIREEENDVVVDEKEKEPLVVVKEIVVEVSDEKGEPEILEVVEVNTVVVEENKGQEKQNGVERETTNKNKGYVVKNRDEGKADEDKKTETPQEISTSSREQRPVSQGEQEISSENPSQPALPASTNEEAKKKKNAKKKPQPSQPQSKAVYDDEKIWEQIEAVRKIVGYKVTAQKTSLEELKALYIFTGVKPPGSFKEPSDLAEVQNKLQFLKSIIGVN